MCEAGYEPFVFAPIDDAVASTGPREAAETALLAFDKRWGTHGTVAGESATIAAARARQGGYGDFDPETSITVRLNAQLSRCSVHSVNLDRERADVAGVVALDGVCTDAMREELLTWMTAPGWDHSKGPPTDKWERATRDQVGDEEAPPSWGLKAKVLDELADPERCPPAALEVIRRVAALYPEFDVDMMPASAMAGQMALMEDEDGSEGEGDGADASASGPCIRSHVGNASMAGDTYAWHRDMDPSAMFFDSPWAERYGCYANREMRKPYLVSALLYLDEDWPDAWDAETLFYDESNGSEGACGLFSRPAPGRIVLMDQDVKHRVSPPSANAKRPRYSLVWKLAFYPHPGGAGYGDKDTTEATRRGHYALTRKRWGKPGL
eukprot:PRCOL_00006334-RA